MTLTDDDIMMHWAATPNTGDMRIDLVVFARTLLAAGASEGQASEYKRMFEDAVRSLAAIDAALGIDPDEAGGAAPILEAIDALKLLASSSTASVSDPCMCSGLGPCFKLSNCRRAPSVADAAGASSEDVKKAARYDWLRSKHELGGQNLDEQIDSAIEQERRNG